MEKMEKKLFFEFEGHCLGISEDGIPRKMGEYNTVRYGWLDHFYRGREGFILDGIKYRRVSEKYRPGDPKTPGRYKATYVAVED